MLTKKVSKRDLYTWLGEKCRFSGKPLESSEELHDGTILFSLLVSLFPLLMKDKIHQIKHKITSTDDINHNWNLIHTILSQLPLPSWVSQYAPKKEHQYLNIHAFFYFLHELNLDHTFSVEFTFPFDLRFTNLLQSSACIDLVTSRRPSAAIPKEIVRSSSLRRSIQSTNFPSHSTNPPPIDETKKKVRMEHDSPTKASINTTEPLDDIFTEAYISRRASQRTMITENASQRESRKESEEIEERNIQKSIERKDTGTSPFSRRRCSAVSQRSSLSTMVDSPTKNTLEQSESAVDALLDYFKDRFLKKNKNKGDRETGSGRTSRKERMAESYGEETIHGNREESKRSKRKVSKREEISHLEEQRAKSEDSPSKERSVDMESMPPLPVPHSSAIKLSPESSFMNTLKQCVDSLSTISKGKEQPHAGKKEKLIADIALRPTNDEWIAAEQLANLTIPLSRPPLPPRIPEEDVPNPRSPKVRHSIQQKNIVAVKEKANHVGRVIGTTPKTDRVQPIEQKSSSARRSPSLIGNRENSMHTGIEKEDNAPSSARRIRSLSSSSRAVSPANRIDRPSVQEEMENWKRRVEERRKKGDEKREMIQKEKVQRAEREADAELVLMEAYIPNKRNSVRGEYLNKWEEKDSAGKNDTRGRDFHQRMLKQKCFAGLLNNFVECKNLSVIALEFYRQNLIYKSFYSLAFITKVSVDKKKQMEWNNMQLADRYRKKRQFLMILSLMGELSRENTERAWMYEEYLLSGKMKRILLGWRKVVRLEKIERIQKTENLSFLSVKRRFFMIWLDQRSLAQRQQKVENIRKSLHQKIQQWRAEISLAKEESSTLFPK